MSISDEALIKWSADIRRFLTRAREAYLKRKQAINDADELSFEKLYELAQLCKFCEKQEMFLEAVAVTFDYVVNGHVATDFKEVYDKTMRKAGDDVAYLEHVETVSPVARLSGTLDVLRDTLAREDAIKNN